MPMPHRLIHPVRRVVLARAARAYADHAWPVVPGARLVDDRFDCGRPGCFVVSCHPARPDWSARASHDPAQVAAWWHRVDHGVLLATGHSFDVLEVVGPAGWHIGQEVRGPVAVAPGQRWMFPVLPGEELLPELAGRHSVVLHAAGSWIPAPPTPLPVGRVRWKVSPRRYGWRTGDPLEVQRAAVRTLRFDRQVRPVRRLVGQAAVPAVE